jgi:hypothetical protein
MQNYSIIISFRISGILPELCFINFITEQFENLFSKTFSTLSYTITDKSSFYWKQKTKSVKLTVSNLQKLEEILFLKNQNIDVSFELLKNTVGCEFKSRDIDFSVSYSNSENINGLNFILSDKLFKEKDLKTLVQIISTYLLKQNCQVLYCFISNVENEKLPAFYIEGIGTPSLSRFETQRIKVWSANKLSCDEKIWDIFWGNIISTKHIVNEYLISDVEKMIGKDNAVLLAPGLLLFNLPESLNSFEISNYSSKRKEIYDYFSNLDLIMK